MSELQDYAEVRAGHPFRGSVPEVIDGVALTIQMRDVSMARGVAWSSVARTNPAGRKKPDWLKVGDILFLARGAHNFAVYLEQVPEQTVCSQYFFLIRVNDPTLLPSFLAWQINQLPAQNYFRKNAEGSDQLSIRRGILEALPIAIPSLTQQRQLLRFAKAAQQERQYMENMIRNRERQIQGIVLQLLNIHDAPAPVHSAQAMEVASI
jgi:hypothetical protein